MHGAPTQVESRNFKASERKETGNATARILGRLNAWCAVELNEIVAPLRLLRPQKVQRHRPPTTENSTFVRPHVKHVRLAIHNRFTEAGMRTPYRGFTLIELMITIAILAIILAMAIPSFTQAIENARLGTQTNEFVTAVSSARAEALRTGAPVWLTAKGEGFQNGWCVRASADACGTADPADLLDHPALDARIVLSYRVALPALPTTTSFEFTRLGTLASAGAATTIELAPPGCPAGRTKRRIGINAVGRVSVERVDC